MFQEAVRVISDSLKRGRQAEGETDSVQQSKESMQQLVPENDQHSV